LPARAFAHALEQSTPKNADAKPEGESKRPGPAISRRTDARPRGKIRPKPMPSAVKAYPETRAGPAEHEGSWAGEEVQGGAGQSGPGSLPAPKRYASKDSAARRMPRELCIASSRFDTQL